MESAPLVPVLTVAAVPKPKLVRAAAAVIAPVPPLVIGNTPLTPGVMLAEPLNDAAVVLRGR
jgi:hypothetical protein